MALSSWSTTPLHYFPNLAIATKNDNELIIKSIGIHRVNKTTAMMSAAKYLWHFCYNCSPDFRLELAREQLREIVHFLPISYSRSLLSIYGGSGSVVFHSYHVCFSRKVIQKTAMLCLAQHLTNFTRFHAEIYQNYQNLEAWKEELAQLSPKFEIAFRIHTSCEVSNWNVLVSMNVSEKERWLDETEKNLHEFIQAHQTDMGTDITGTKLYKDYQDILVTLKLAKKRVLDISSSSDGSDTAEGVTEIPQEASSSAASREGGGNSAKEKEKEA